MSLLINSFVIINQWEVSQHFRNIQIIFSYWKTYFSSFTSLKYSSILYQCCNEIALFYYISSKFYLRCYNILSTLQKHLINIAISHQLCNNIKSTLQQCQINISTMLHILHQHCYNIMLTLPQCHINTATMLY